MKILNLILGSFLLMGSSLAAQGVPFETGKPFPVIPLPRLSGGELATIEDFRGQKLVLHIWASW